MQEYADNWTQQALIESNGGQMLTKVDGKVKAGLILRNLLQLIRL